MERIKATLQQLVRRRRGKGLQEECPILAVLDREEDAMPAVDLVYDESCPTSPALGPSFCALSPKLDSPFGGGSGALMMRMRPARSRIRIADRAC